MSKIQRKKDCLISKNNPDPIPFIKVKAEPTINDKTDVDGQNSNEIYFEFNLNENGKATENHQSTQNHLNLVETENTINNLVNISTAHKNIELNKEERLEINIHLLNRIEYLSAEFDSSKAEKETKVIKISEIERKNKEKKDLLNRKSEKIILLKERVKSLKEKLKNGNRLQVYNREKKRVSLFYSIKISIFFLKSILIKKLRVSPIKLVKKSNLIESEYKGKSSDNETSIFSDFFLKFTFYFT